MFSAVTPGDTFLCSECRGSCIKKGKESPLTARIGGEVESNGLHEGP